jgi:cytochrome c biogenesis factor
VNALGEASLWLALAGAAWRTGLELGSPQLPVGRRASGDGAAIATAALAVLGWSSLAGALLRGDASLALFVEGVPVDVPAGYRLAALWGTPRGALLTLALILVLASLVSTAAIRRVGARAAGRGTFVAMCALQMLALALSVLWKPPYAPATSARLPADLPAYLAHAAAAVAPLLAVGSVAVTLLLAAALVVPPEPGPSARWDGLLRRQAITAWLIATLALAAEQAARTALDLTTADAVVPGGSAGGLLLWLALGALMHHRVRAALATGGAVADTAARPRYALSAAHAGAVLAVASFALHIVAARADVVLPPGRSVESRDGLGRPWQLVNQGVSRFDAAGREVTALALEVTPPGRAARLLSTEQRRFVARSGAPFGEPIGIRASIRGIAQDFGVVLRGAMEGDVARVRVSFVPLAFLWPAGILLMLVAAATLLRPEREGQRPVPPPSI